MEGETGITEEGSDKAPSEIASVTSLVNTTLNSRQDNTLLPPEVDGDVTLTNGIKFNLYNFIHRLRKEFKRK